MKIATQNKETEKKRIPLKREQKRLIFYVLMLAWPVLQYACFYFYVNINSFVLAFQKYETNLGSTGGMYNVSFTFFENFKSAFKIIGDSGEMLRNSIVIITAEVLVIAILALFFSFYIAKSYKGAGFFRVILYMPSIVSSVVLVLLYKYIMNNGFVDVFEGLMGEEWLIERNLQNGLLGSDAPKNIQFAVILFYNLFVAFGMNVILYSGGMSGVDPSIVESAHLDGVNPFQELIYIYIPMIWPTIVTLITTSLTGMFTNQLNLLPFYGTLKTPPFEVFGYFLYKQTLASDLVPLGSGTYSYSVLSALGLLITLVLVPVVLTVRKLLLKHGPSAD